MAKEKTPEIPPEPLKNPLILSVFLLDGDSWIFEKLDVNGKVVQRIERCVPIGHKARVSIRRALSTNQKYLNRVMEEERKRQEAEEEKARQATEAKTPE